MAGVRDKLVEKICRLSDDPLEIADIKLLKEMTTIVKDVDKMIRDEEPTTKNETPGAGDFYTAARAQMLTTEKQSVEEEDYEEEEEEQ